MICLNKEETLDRTNFVNIVLPRSVLAVFSYFHVEKLNKNTRKKKIKQKKLYFLYIELNSALAFAGYVSSRNIAVRFPSALAWALQFMMITICEGMYTCIYICTYKAGQLD